MSLLKADGPTGANKGEAKEKCDGTSHKLSVGASNVRLEGRTVRPKSECWKWSVAAFKEMCDRPSEQIGVVVLTAQPSMVGQHADED